MAERDQYWTVVGHTMTQFLSLVEGYGDSPSSLEFPISASELFLMNSLGDTDDLIVAMNYTRNKRLHASSSWSSSSPPSSRGDLPPPFEFCYEPWCVSLMESRSHCSSLVKPISGDLYVTHNMWTWYWQMLSVWKQYDFQLRAPGIVSSRVAFSSWPGMLSSEDDFYVTGQGFLIAETTNNVYNLTLYDLLSPHSLVAWVRATTSNYMARNAFEWHEIFKTHNSGTYNNQWVVTDTNKRYNGSRATDANSFQRATEQLWVLPPGTVVVGSQLPNFYMYEDVTPFINQHGYWASYNVPYFKAAWVRSGYQLMERMYGDLFSWENTPRAKIFRQRQGNITDLESLKRFMRYNDWQHDPLALNCPMNQIAARADLSPANGSDPLCLLAPFGAVNAKISSSSRLKTFTAEYIVGPTHDTQPTFSWSPEFVAKYPIPHYGQAKTYNFDWHTMRHPMM